MTSSDGFERATVDANGIDFTYLATGPVDGPLALCLHGFPDTPATFRHLAPALAGLGHRVVMPWMRGYHPTSLAPDGNYQRGALSADALALHDRLGGDRPAVLVGHDWGALAAYGAAGAEPDRWSSMVTAAVPPVTVAATALTTYGQIKRSFYVWFFQTGLAESMVAADDLAFIDGLWSDWAADGYDAGEDLPAVKEALRPEGRLAAAIGYYRAMLDPTTHDPALAAVESAGFAPTTVRTLYLHGRSDGCMVIPEAPDEVLAFLGPGSEARWLDDTGHFLFTEVPEVAVPMVVEFLQAAP